MPRAGLALIFLGPLLPSCAERTPLQALDQGFAFLNKQQKPDGSFRSGTYGILRTGHSLTAIISYCYSLARVRLRKGTSSGATHLNSLRRALAFLAGTLAKDVRLGKSEGLADYPNYAAAFHLLALSNAKPMGWSKTAVQQAGYLRAAQLVEELGWEYDDVQYGGFGLGGAIEKKPMGAGYLNISVTSWVLQALSAFGHAPRTALFTRARVFVARCQNFAGSGGGGTDGGFVFTTFPDFQQSKAGLRKKKDGVDVPARSYGSATVDGICALLACGQRVTSPRMIAARRWIETHFNVYEVPGFGDEGEFGIREKSLRLYYLASLARAMRQMEEKGVKFAGRAARWRSAIQERLMGLQGGDGAWRGHEGMKEDDPLVGTPLALLGLLATL